MQKKCRFWDLNWPLGIKWKFRNLIAHLQVIPNHILEYHLCILWNIDKVPVTAASTKNVIFWPLIDPWGKNENSKTLLRICKTIAQSDPRIWFRYDLKCRPSSSDKKFFRRTATSLDVEDGWFDGQVFLKAAPHPFYILHVNGLSSF